MINFFKIKRFGGLLCHHNKSLNEPRQQIQSCIAGKAKKIKEKIYKIIAHKRHTKKRPELLPLGPLPEHRTPFSWIMLCLLFGVLPIIWVLSLVLLTWWSHYSHRRPGKLKQIKIIIRKSLEHSPTTYKHDHTFVPG